ncbi:FeoC-like transcriptional regulator [Streptomyces sp. NPDC001941]|uniref:FeoC-like transcriptional regulator n=1 Tax=Streptomyces sp. NPDC001941 TaxID=3154659 RepID=UPI00332881BD
MNVSPLRHVLVAVRRARGSVRVEDIAAEAGVAPDEAASMIEYWVRRGVLTREEVNGGCPPAGCGGCPARTSCGTPALGGTPLLHTIRVTEPGGS